MRKITNFFVFLLLGATITASLMNFGFMCDLKDRTESLYRRDLRHWLSLQARVEILEDEISSLAESSTTESMSEKHETEDVTEDMTEATVATDEETLPFREETEILPEPEIVPETAPSA